MEYNVWSVMYNTNSIEILVLKVLQYGHSVMLRVRRLENRREFTLFNIYAAVGHIEEKYDQEFRVIERYVERNNLRQLNNIIVAGDLNLNLADPTAHPHHYARFKTFLQRLNLYDTAVKAYRQLFPTWRGFGDRSASKSRIDIILCSKNNPALNFVKYSLQASLAEAAADRVQVNSPSDPKIIPWKDNILTSRVFKTEAQKALIHLLSGRVVDPTLVNLNVFNDDNTGLHKRVKLLDTPHNIETQDGDLTYLLPIILSKWKSIHDSIFLEYSEKSTKYKYESFQKSFSAICKKTDFTPGALGPKEELSKLRKERQEDIVTTKANIRGEIKIKNLLNVGKTSGWSFSYLKIKGEKKSLKLFNGHTEIEDSDDIISTLAQFHAEKNLLR